jgi:hypothetical protein
MRRFVIALLVGAIALDVVYWSLWFLDRDLIASEHTTGYYDFENAFPLADLWLGVACLLALVAMLRGSSDAAFWIVCAGSAGAYLFAMDFLYDVENGIFTHGGAGAFEGVVVAVTLIFAVTMLSHGRRLVRSSIDS